MATIKDLIFGLRGSDPYLPIAYRIYDLEYVRIVHEDIAESYPVKLTDKELRDILARVDDDSTVDDLYDGLETAIKSALIWKAEDASHE